MKKLTVLIPDGGTVMSLPVARCLALLADVEVHMLVDEFKIDVQASRAVQSVKKVDYDSSEAWMIEQINQGLQATGADILFPLVEKTMLTLIEHQAQLPSTVSLIALPKIDSIHDSMHKARFIEQVQALGFSVPQSLLWNRASRDVESIRAIPSPLILKPNIGEGGVGVMKFATHEALFNHLEQIETNEDLIVQSFIEGQHLDFSFWLKRVKCGLMPRKQITN